MTATSPEPSELEARLRRDFGPDGDWASCEADCHHGECDAGRHVLALLSDPGPETAEATRDVLAERQKQIDKGYTPEHDDEHTVAQLLRYGGMEWFLPHTLASRKRMVRAAACLLAAIERLDRDPRVTPPAAPAGPEAAS
jgi:hypothetical protein